MKIQLITISGLGNKIPGAKIAFMQGASEIVSFKTDANGSYTIDTEFDGGLFNDGIDILVTAPGYQSAGINSTAINGYNEWVFTMAKKPNVELALGAGAFIAAGLLWANSKNRRVTGFKDNVLPYVVPGAVVIGGFLVVNKLFQALGITKTPEQQQRDNALDTTISNSTQTQTLSDGVLSTIADTIHEDLGYSAVSNNTSDAARQLIKVGNTIDLLKLIKLYGLRYITFFGIPRGQFTLEQTVTSQMSATEIEEINKYYSAMGIDFKF